MTISRRAASNLLVSLVALAAVLVALPATSTAASPGTTKSGQPSPHLFGFGAYIGERGTSLTMGGKTWKMAGYNLPCEQPFLLSSDDLMYYFEDIKVNSGANVVRMWWFQSEMGTGSDPWAPYEQIVAAAKAEGIRLIVTLTDEYDNCDEPNPPTSQKSLSWYQGGYESPEGGYALSYKTYVTEMAAHFANEPTIAFWQLVNEAEAPTIAADGTMSCDPSAAMVALRSFADDMTTAIHKVDIYHMVNLGTQGTGQCGTNTDAAYQYVNAGIVNLCEVHDYSNPAVLLATGQDTVGDDISICHKLGKPIFIGESGIPANVQPDGSSPSTDPITSVTLNQRATFFKAKIDAANTAGVAGYVIWFKSPFYTPTADQYAIGEGDPTEAVLADALR